VQVDRDDAVGARGLEQVGDQARRDGLATAVLLVLPGVGIERQDRGDALGATPLEGVDHQQLFHQPLVQRSWMGLQDEGIAATDGFVEADEDLAVGEVAGRLRGDADVQLLGDLLCQLGVCAPREQHQVLAIVGPFRGHVGLPLPSGIDTG
jgi:hypothetical protein